MKYLLLLTAFLTLLQAKEASVEQLFSVQTVKVQQVNVAKNIKSYGFVKADESRIYDVSPRFGGYVEVLYADKLYLHVNKGEALAKVYSPEVVKAKDDYLNTLNYTKIRPNTTILKSAKERLSLLNISQNEIDAIDNEHVTSSFTTIVSPAEGYIFSKSLNHNSAFNAKNTVFKIVNLDKVWVEVKIHQNQLNTLHGVEKFTLNTSAYAQSFEAKKVQLYPELDPKEESFTLRLEVKNESHLLKPGMYATVEMSSINKSYLTLPATAVIRKNGKFYVFRVGEYAGEYEPSEVTAEVYSPEIYIIKSGVNDGDEVVNNALFMMDSDAQINGLY